MVLIWGMWLPYTKRMNRKAVLFDMDGVIIDSEPAHEAAFLHTLVAAGEAPTGNWYKQHFAGKTDEAGFRSYFGSKSPPDISWLMRSKTTFYTQHLSTEVTPYAATVATVKELHAQRTTLGLVTSSSREEAEAILTTLELLPLFSVVVYAEYVILGKPNPEGYIQAMRALDATPDRCTIIEDSPSGVAAAKAAGAKVIALQHTHTPAELYEADVVTEQIDARLLQ